MEEYIKAQLAFNKEIMGMMHQMQRSIYGMDTKKVTKLKDLMQFYYDNMETASKKAIKEL